MKYAIVFLSGDQIIYIKNDAIINDGLYEKYVDSKIPMTQNENEALLLDSLDEAKDYIYKLKYHYRKLFNIKVGVKMIKDVKEITDNEMFRDRLLK